MPRITPILMSTIMVQSTLDGLKNVTRRIMDVQPVLTGYMWEVYGAGWGDTFSGKMSVPCLPGHSMANNCRYGQIGDLLWIREKWRIYSWDFDDQTCTIEYATGEIIEHPLSDECSGVFTADWLQNQIDAMAEKGILEIVEKEDQEEDEIFYKRTGKHQPWKPSIHMPKHIARIWLEITYLKIERVQHISDDQAKSEGVKEWVQIKELAKHLGSLGDWKVPHPYSPYQFAFLALWCKINGAESWLKNPWVWVVQFKVLSTTGKPESMEESHGKI